MQYVLGLQLGYALSGGLYVSILGFLFSMIGLFNHRKDKLLIELYEKSKKDENTS